MVKRVIRGEDGEDGAIFLVRRELGFRVEKRRRKRLGRWGEHES